MSGTAGASMQQTENGNPDFRVVGSPRSREEEGSLEYTPNEMSVIGQLRGAGSGRMEQLSRGSTSLENNPPPTLDPRMWSEADGTDFIVRGESYLSTKVKVTSAKQVHKG